MGESSGSAPRALHISSVRLERPARQELRIPLRFRMEGQKEWLPGETVNLSKNGLLFSADVLMEIDAKIEITFHTSDIPAPGPGSRRAQIVRRVLNNWPEIRPSFGAKFL